MSGKKLIVIAGPTAVGKTAVAIAVAQRVGAVIVSADSRQFFREMNIGTAKPTAAERAAVKHYFIDSHGVAEAYDAAQYAEEALALIQDLFSTYDNVILCGGSGLYIKGVCQGFDEIPAVPEAVRSALMHHYQLNGLPWLQARIRELDPEAAAVIDMNNPHRLVRALEVRMHTGKSITSFRKNTKKEHGFEIIKIGLELPRTELYARIDARMEGMITAGLFEEAAALYPLRSHNALQTVGYKEIFDYMDGGYDREECVRLLKRNSRRYAKRQLTWFKKDPGFKWFGPAEVVGMIDYIRDAETSS